ncbi:nucleoside phosphorylase [Candidatus Bathyarchaeota archaeon]|nr:nucleoside phosphorylase [Candidatus Bathyarchaeota archaeon]
MSKRIQPHIMCGIGDVARYVLMPGDPNRVQRIAEKFDNAKKKAEYRGYVTYTGETGAVGITSTSSGIGCPSTAIAMEELMKIGADTFIRVGTCGALVPQLDSGDIVVATGAVRWEGTSKTYIDTEYPAVASYQVVNALLKAADELNIKVHPGIIISSDAYYGGNDEVLHRFGEANVLAIEMESSLMFTLANMRGVRAGSICTVDGNIFKGTGKGEFEAGEKSGELAEKVQRSIDDEIRLAVRAVQRLDEG